MRVLHITPYMHPSAGGPPVVVDRLLRFAPTGRWTGSVITTSLFCDDDGSELERSLNDRFEAMVLKQDRPRILGLASGAAQAIEGSVRRSDIVHLHGLWHPFNTLARRACARHGRRYLLMPHGMLDPNSLAVKTLRKRFYLRLRERANLEAADHLIFATASEEQFARAELPWLGDGEVIALGADEPPAIARQALAADFLEKFPAATARRRLLFLGRVHPKKGVEFILAALPAIVTAYPDVLLVIAGPGEEPYLQALKRQIQRGDLAGHVLFTGMLLDPEKWGAIAAAELFILPSHQENFAIAVAEAMRMGLPVILSDRVNTAREIAEAEAGVVLKHDGISQTLSVAVTALLADRKVSSAIGRRAREFARQRYDWRITAELTFKLYDRILAERNPAAGSAGDR